MAALTGTAVRAVLAGWTNANLSTELRELDAETFAPRSATWPRIAGTAPAPRRIGRGLGRSIAGQRIGRSYYDDYYNRVHVRPAALTLGNIASEQLRPVYVWNAWPDRTQLLASVETVDAEGITIATPGALPLSFAPLQERTFNVSVATSGPPVIDAAIVLNFTGLDGITVSISGNRLIAWPLPADWGQDVDESLEWLTDIQRSINGSRTAIPLREAPRREWEFSIVAGRRERRIVENALYDWTARVWALPVWTDVEFLRTPLAAGSTQIPVVTAGLDFAVGGLVMLWTDVQRYELVEVATVEADRLMLARPSVSGWARGTRVYPCRNARLADAPQIKRKNDQVMVTRARFQATEPCDWPAVAPPTTYLGIPVLEQRSDEEQDPESAFARELVTLDGDIGLTAVDDLTQLAWQRQTHARKVYGRAARAAHRSLLYWLQGRARVVWLPTWTDDVQLLDAVTAAGSSLVVAWSGIGQFLRQQDGRRHLRIELLDGTVLHRRVSGTQEINAERERLLLDAPVGIAIAPARVRLICWMVVSHQAADRVEIAHASASDGLANVRTSFMAAGREEP